MGVKGLWSLLSPVARPIKLETLEGKRLAIDSSIWLYQFQATMRDKDGRVLVNAHVLGFLRRINKLLFHGIKPVFVFDGGAPALKRSTIAERKRKKQGAAANHAKVAEKLFAAQMRREAVKAAQAAREKNIAEADAYVPPGAQFEYVPEAGEQIDENAVYMDDLDGDDPRPPRPALARHDSSMNSVPAETPLKEETAAEAAAKRRKAFKNHDPYRLPEMEQPIASSSRSGEKPDPRMATEEELRSFIEDMKPEDFDVNSPEFRSLPTEVQYEIVGDLRIRSRQQSHRRLASMLRSAPTPLDFSKAQIANLSKRNTLTQQLLTVTDTIGTSGLQIPVRVASERNREYVLVRNKEADGGGWVLGVRDQGSKEKPIVIEESPKSQRRKQAEARKWLDSDEEDDEVKEVPRAQVVDPDLRRMRQQQMIDALTQRLTPKKVGKMPDLGIVAKPRTPGQKALFGDGDEDLDEDEAMEEVTAGDRVGLDEAFAMSLQQAEVDMDPVSLDEDSDLQAALRMSRAEVLSEEDEEDEAMRRAIEASKKDARLNFDAGSRATMGMDLDTPVTSTSTTVSTAASTGGNGGDDDLSDDGSMEEVVVPTSTLNTPEEPASVPPEYFAIPADLPPSSKKASADSRLPPLEGLGSLDQRLIEAAIAADQAKLVQPGSRLGGQRETASPSIDVAAPQGTEGYADIEADEGMAEIEAVPTSSRKAYAPPDMDLPLPITATIPAPPTVTHNAVASSSRPPPTLAKRYGQLPHTPAQKSAPTPAPALQRTSVSAVPQSMGFPSSVESRTIAMPIVSHPARVPSPIEVPDSPIDVMDVDEDPPAEQQVLPVVSESESDVEYDGLSRALLRQPTKTPPGLSDEEDDDMDDSRSLEWSKSPSPGPRAPGTFPAPPPDLEEDEGGVDMNAEGDDYARFLAQIKGRNLEQVRQEIDNEIRTLNAQNTVAMRDSEDITQQMVAQIQLMLRLFGIPYITAPMEAEAQCAKLAELNLVDGVITDDNDVFLFGGSQCFKNLFNDAKYVECFLASDLDRELSLTRDRLITLAYLLGSDYTVGLPHVGPIVGMELMANFPGPEGLMNFKKWWLEVQNGKDVVEGSTKWQKSFKKKFSDVIYIGPDWPNPLVREAYEDPTVDASDEPFQWGFPDLSGLRSFLQAELSWSISKADDELTPIVSRIARRGVSGSMAAAEQTTLDPFFDMSLGALSYVPRVRAKHPSKRLQSVIKAFREAEARVAGKEVPVGFGEMLKDLEEDGLVKFGDEEDGDDDSLEARPKKGKGKRKAAAAEEGVEGAEPKKKKRAPPRKKKTVDSFASEAGDGSTVASIDGDEVDGDGDFELSAKRAKRTKSTGGRGRGRGGASSAGSRASSVRAGDVAEEAGGGEVQEVAVVQKARPRPKARTRVVI